MEKAYLLCDFETTGVDIEKDYPIELGGIFLDTELNTFDYISSLIYDKSWDLFNSNQWKKEYEQSYKIHKITVEELRNNGISPISLIENLHFIKNKHSIEKLIIISDNSQFEYSFMKKLYELANAKNIFPFHYCAWDTSLLFELLNIQETQPIHRALPDVLRVYKDLCKAKNIIDYYKNNCRCNK